MSADPWAFTDDELTLLAQHPEKAAEVEALLEAQLAEARRATDEAAVAEARAQMTTRWQGQARPEQLPPAGLWFVWLILAGRGWGKTRTGAEWAAAQGRNHPGARVAIVAATFSDARDTMIEGESGLLSVLDESELRGGSRDTAWNRSLGELYLANGSRYKVFSSEKPRQLRGPQHHFGWADEPAEWKDADRGARAAPEADTTWSNLVIGMRLPPRGDWPEQYRPRIVATGTPKRRRLLKSRDENNPGLLQQPDLVTVTTGRTVDNLPNLADTYVQTVIRPIEGTRLAEQELEGRLLEDVEGALWRPEDIERGRRGIGDVWQLLEARVVAVDPATTAKESSDNTGIVAVGRGLDRHGYVLDDRSARYTPVEWASTAWRLAVAWECEAIVVEDNQGGDMVEHTLVSVWPTLPESRQHLPPPIRRVRAVVNKRARAMPIAGMYEQVPPTVHHVVGAGAVIDNASDLVELEDELTTWDGTGDSPDRLDAMVHGLRYLLLPDASTGERRVVRGERWARVSGRR